MESYKEERAKQVAASSSSQAEDQDSQMQAANLGVKLGPTASTASSGSLDAAKFKKRKAKGGKHKGRKR